MSRGDFRQSPIPLAPPPTPIDVGIVAAMGIEIAPILLRLEGVRKYAAQGTTIVEGTLAGKLVAIVETGVGRARAQVGAERLILGHRPRWLVSAGFAGGLDPGLSRNRVVYPVEVVNVEGRVFPITAPPGWSPPPPAVHSGRLLTTDEIVITAAGKAELHRVHGAALVDMETSAVAATSAQHRVKFLSIRIISDDASTDLPREVLSILGGSGSYRVGKAIGAIWRRPSSLKELLALREQGNISARHLATAFLQLLPTL